MNLHEYQAKRLLSEYNLPVSRGIVIDSVKEIEDAVSELGGDLWVAKVQVHAGGRGKAGGVKLISNKEEMKEFARQWLGKRLVTYQTDADGQPVNKLLIELCCDIEQELYLGAVVDRAMRRLVVMASTEGGVEIEKVAEVNPEKILKSVIDPLWGAHAYQGRAMAFQLGLKGSQVRQFTEIFLGIVRLCLDKDVSLFEINPLVIKKDGDLHCLDAKIGIDGNAMYRQPKLKDMHDLTQEDERESHAAQWDLNYVALDGNIGCMVNGAGLAMGTMDIIKLYGGQPANFLDVGGGATQERVTEAFKIILSDASVLAVLVNIFGGIVRCDLIADGIIGAVKDVGVNIPVVVRLEGNNARLGVDKLKASGLDIIAVDSLEDAANQVVKEAGVRK